MSNNIEFKRKMPTPKELKNEIPLSKKAKEIKEKKDKEIAINNRTMFSR